MNRRKWKKQQLQKWGQRNYVAFLGCKIVTTILIIVIVGIIGVVFCKAKKKGVVDVISHKGEVADLVDFQEIEKVLEEKQPKVEMSYDSIQKEEKKVKYVLLAEHTIDNPASGENRNHNMRRVMEIICGEDKDYYVLLPEETFSYLEVVGDTTLEKGFLEAGVILYGEPATGIGGGVCQVTTTLNSALQKIPDLKKDKEHLHAEKHNANKPLAYINPANGDLEASVAFSNNKDFWVVNTLDYPMMFKFEIEKGKVTVRIFGVIEE